MDMVGNYIIDSTLENKFFTPKFTSNDSTRCVYFNWYINRNDYTKISKSFKALTIAAKKTIWNLADNFGKANKDYINGPKFNTYKGEQLNTEAFNISYNDLSSKSFKRASNDNSELKNLQKAVMEFYIMVNSKLEDSITTQSKQRASLNDATNKLRDLSFINKDLRDDVETLTLKMYRFRQEVLKQEEKFKKLNDKVYKELR